MGEEIKDEVIVDNGGTTVATVNAEEVKDVDNQIPYERFKQKVDEANALKVKLAKIEADEVKKEELRLKEKEDYKTLYEQAQEQVRQQQEIAIDAKKDTLLIQAGYSQEQTELLRKLITGTSDEELKISIETVKESFPVEVKRDYVDLGLGNGRRTEVKPKGGEGFGKSLYQRVMNK